MKSPSLPSKHAGDRVAELLSICVSFSCCQHSLCMSTDEADDEGAAGAWTGWLHTPEAKQEGMAQHSSVKDWGLLGLRRLRCW